MKKLDINVSVIKPENIHFRIIKDKTICHITDDLGTILYKSCSNCQKVMALDKFYPQKGALGDRSPMCRPCRSAYAVQNRRDRKEGKSQRSKVVTIAEKNLKILSTVKRSVSIAGTLTYMEKPDSRCLVMVEMGVNKINLLVKTKDVGSNHSSVYLLGRYDSIEAVEYRIRNAFIELSKKVEVLDNSPKVDTIVLEDRTEINVSDIKDKLSAELFDFTTGETRLPYLVEVLRDYDISEELWTRASEQPVVFRPIEEDVPELSIEEQEDNNEDHVFVVDE